MSLAAFLQSLLTDGEARFAERPMPGPRDREEAGSQLEQAFADYRLDIAGALIVFDSETALAAAEVLRQACWFLVNAQEPDAELESRLKLPFRADSAAAHLSADLVLRFLPQVHRRARSLNPSDRLPRLLAAILRAWPLSGVESDVEEGPLSPLEFAGHEGLLLLYAERLARHPKPAWTPSEGRLREYIDLVAGEITGQGRQIIKAAPRNDRERDDDAGT